MLSIADRGAMSSTYTDLVPAKSRVVRGRGRRGQGRSPRPSLCRPRDPCDPRIAIGSRGASDGHLSRIRGPGGQLPPRRPEVSPVPAILGTVLGDQGPEARAVVRLPGVAELVREDIVHEGRGQEQEPRVQRDAPRPGTAPPAAAGETNRRAGVGEPEGAAQVREPGHEVHLSFSHEPATEGLAARRGVPNLAGQSELARTDREHSDPARRCRPHHEQPLGPHRGKGEGRGHQPRDGRRERLPARRSVRQSGPDPGLFLGQDAGDCPPADPPGGDNFEGALGGHPQRQPARPRGHAEAVVHQRVCPRTA